MRLAMLTIVAALAASSALAAPDSRDAQIVRLQSQLQALARRAVQDEAVIAAMREREEAALTGRAETLLDQARAAQAQQAQQQRQASPPAAKD